MQTPLTTEISAVSDLSHEARRFRTILWTFERNTELLLKGTGLAHTVDHQALALAFANWRKAFDETRDYARVNRKDYVIYAAGLMLRELIAAKPLAISGAAQGGAALADPRFARWPEGYVYTSFCLAFVSTIIGSDGEELVIPPAAESSTGFWDSFRENTQEFPETAVAFFDFICGQQPDWESPGVPHLRPGMKLARLASRKA